MNKQTIKILVGLTVVLVFICIYFLNIKKGIILQVPTTPQVSKIIEKKIEDKNDFYDISVMYPVEKLDKDAVMEKFVNYKVAEKKEEWKVGGKAYTEEKAIELRQSRVSRHDSVESPAGSDFPDRPKMVYQYDMSYKRYESKKLGTVSYVITTYEFTGGANGNTTINTFTFNKNGALAIEGVLDFENNNDIALSKVLADVIIKRDGDQAAPDMTRDGLGISYLKADGKTLDKVKCNCDGFFFPSNFQNFVIEDAGIRFIFNKYQVAPGSAGTPEILLNWETLKPYIQRSFSLQ